MKRKRNPRIESIEKIDERFKLAKIGDEKFNFYDPASKPFGFTGFPWYDREEVFCRLPVDSIEKMDKIRGGAWHTAGGQIRFRSNSDKIALRVKLRSKGDMSHMPRTGSAGFDLYVGVGPKQVFSGVCMPPANSDSYEAIIGRGLGNKTSDLAINFPLYNGVEKVELGVLPGTKVTRPKPLAVKKPILFYGSSITQGGCASHPGNAFGHILCRWLDAPQINLGFSGSGMLEPIMAELIADLKISVLVMDSSNTSLEQKRERHERFFKIVREKQPNLPIVIGCRADYRNNVELHGKRRAVAMRTCRNAVKRGDRLVLFADIKKAFGKYYDFATVDGCHPTDVGFVCMAEAYLPVLRKALRMR